MCCCRRRGRVTRRRALACTSMDSRASSALTAAAIAPGMQYTVLLGDAEAVELLFSRTRPTAAARVPADVAARLPASLRSASQLAASAAAPLAKPSGASCHAALQGCLLRRSTGRPAHTNVPQCMTRSCGLRSCASCMLSPVPSCHVVRLWYGQRSTHSLLVGRRKPAAHRPPARGVRARGRPCPRRFMLGQSGECLAASLDDVYLVMTMYDTSMCARSARRGHVVDRDRASLPISARPGSTTTRTGLLPPASLSHCMKLERSQILPLVSSILGRTSLIGDDSIVRRCCLACCTCSNASPLFVA